ncbi:hypothetical protein D3C81_1918630 [compost metagenome]
MRNVQFAIHLHAARIDVGRTMSGEHVVNNHQLGVDVHLHPFFASRRVGGDQRAHMDFQAGEFR